jgi:hypothetical protein
VVFDDTIVRKVISEAVLECHSVHSRAAVHVGKRRAMARHISNVLVLVATHGDARCAVRKSRWGII